MQKLCLKSKLPFSVMLLIICPQWIVASDSINASAETIVLQLDTLNHQQIFDQNKYSIIEFCNNNLRSCREADKTFLSTAKRLLSERIPITFAKASLTLLLFISVDCSKQRNLCDLHSAGDQPMVKFYNHGKPELVRYGLGFYNQQCFYDEVKNFMASTLTVLRTSSDLEEYFRNTGVLLIGVFKVNCELRNVFLRIAERYRNSFKFAYSDAPEIAAEIGYSHKILLYYPKHLRNKYEPDRMVYSGKSTDSAFKEFLLQNSTGVAGIRTKDNQYLFFRKPLFIVYFNVDYVENAQETRYWRNRVLSVASGYVGKAYFALSNDAIFDQELEEFGLRKNGERLVCEGDKPLVGAITRNGRYRMESEFRQVVENLVEFVKDVLTGKSKKFILSEDVMANSNNFVKIAVRQNFDEIVVKSTKNVFLMLFASICGICRRLSVQFDGLDQEFRNQDVIFVKMDVLANDIPTMFKNVSKDKPNLYWLSKLEKRHPVTYQNDFNIEDIVKFIWSNLKPNFASAKVSSETHADEL